VKLWRSVERMGAPISMSLLHFGGVKILAWRSRSWGRGMFGGQRQGDTATSATDRIRPPDGHHDAAILSIPHAM
jgi:hypothetical protein